MFFPGIRMVNSKNQTQIRLLDLSRKKNFRTLQGLESAREREREIIRHTSVHPAGNQLPTLKFVQNELRSVNLVAYCEFSIGDCPSEFLQERKRLYEMRYRLENCTRLVGGHIV